MVNAPPKMRSRATPDAQGALALDLPDNPNATLPFSIRVADGSPDTNFDPVYFPSRFNEASEKELREEGQQCRGQDVSIKEQKNARIHVTGIVLSFQVHTLRDIYRLDGPVDLLSPLDPQGGMAVFVENGEVGNLQGWDQHYHQWQWEYTMDLVSTGEDEFGNDGENDIVSEIFNS